jgi:hypothetical protein
MKALILSIATTVALAAQAQMDLPASGNNPRATVSEEVGITSITIKYSRPDVAGREGKLWGGNAVPFGFNSANLATGKNNMPLAGRGQRKYHPAS